MKEDYSIMRLKQVYHGYRYMREQYPRCTGLLLLLVEGAAFWGVMIATHATGH